MDNFLGNPYAFQRTRFGAVTIPDIATPPYFGDMPPVIQPMLGSAAGIPNVSTFPALGTDPRIRPPVQGSEPGIRAPMPSDTAPFKLPQGNSLNVGLLGLGADLINGSKPKPAQLGLLQPMQPMGDFRMLYANYLKQMGILA